MPLCFQVESDLHLEFRNCNTPDFWSKFLPKLKRADYLILAGDICTITDAAGRDTYKALMAYCNERWRKTFVITGNHEYYNNHLTNPEKGGEGVVTVSMCDDAIRDIIRPYENVIFLQREAYHMPEHNLVILGATLWTQTLTRPALNDYNAIYEVPHTPITHLDTLAWWTRDSDWLRSQVQSYRDIKVLCITHHLPSFSLVAPRWKGNAINMGFASALEDILRETQYWVCGHTHVPTSMTVEGCQVLINPRGYPGEGVYKPRSLGVTSKTKGAAPTGTASPVRGRP